MTCIYRLDGSVCNNAAAKRASRRLGHFYDEVLAPSGLRATQHALLQQIVRLGSPSMTDLATALVLDRSALSHTLRPLERDALVALHPAKTDRRIKLVVLTEEGRAKLDVCNALWQRAQSRFEATFGVEEATVLRATLDHLAALDFSLRRGRVERPIFSDVKQLVN
ncbi:MarR family winged helix-turn-helix transcriptional regulator [Beijerinckia sp. L45]|uniref:MarR family winged helix-turn-helix transcriptional regulator n=1 Tax=Beijerinckia sp. L45 TaxID=1641855 RepID=UPI0034CE8101